MAVRQQTPLEQKHGFLFLGRDETDDLFVESAGSRIGFHLGAEAVGIFAWGELIDVEGGLCHEIAALVK